jgi:uncharacterized membrane protein YeaQ/YmgE (transglycosylase-associated protein family)
MSLTEFLLLLLIAGICGAAGQALSGYSRGGCLGAIAVGFVGAVIGLWLARVIGLPALFTISISGTAFPIVWSVIGGALFVAILGMFTRRRL